MHEAEIFIGNIVIVAFKPKLGQAEALLHLTRKHVPMLRAEGLANEMPATAMLAADGTVVEVFEWAPGAMEKAHSNPVVQALWARYAEVSDYVPLNTLPETHHLFASFRQLPLTP